MDSAVLGDSVPAQSGKRISNHAVEDLNYLPEFLTHLIKTYPILVLKVRDCSVSQAL